MSLTQLPPPPPPPLLEKYIFFALPSIYGPLPAELKFRENTGILFAASQTQVDDIAHEQIIIILYAVICMSLGGLSAKEKEEQCALNDNDI